MVIVEDDEAMRRALTRMLSAAGFHATAYASAEEMLASASVGRPDCLLIDVGLPGISGFRLYERLARQGSRFPVIFLTARDTPRARQEAARCHAAGFLPKPFPRQTLLSTIRHATGGTA